MKGSKCLIAGHPQRRTRRSLNQSWLNSTPMLSQSQIFASSAWPFNAWDSLLTSQVMTSSVTWQTRWTNANTPAKKNTWLNNSHLAQDTQKYKRRYWSMMRRTNSLPLSRLAVYVTHLCRTNSGSRNCKTPLLPSIQSATAINWTRLASIVERCATSPTKVALWKA